jgi:hypothetical protein
MVTAWVVQWATGDDVRHEWDRFFCRTEGMRGGQWRVEFGPACATIDEAHRWSAERADTAYIEAFGERRWMLHGRGDHPQIGDDEIEGGLAEASRWDDADLGRWEITARLPLGSGAYAEARPVFGRALRELVFALSVVEEDASYRLGATFIVQAPNDVIAELMAGHIMAQAASATGQGLADDLHASILAVVDLP